MEERVNRKLKLLEKRKQLEFEIPKDKVYEELLEAPNQLEIAELLERKELENIKTEYEEYETEYEIINIKVKIIRIELFRRY